jgi:hypothetical protein
MAERNGKCALLNGAVTPANTETSLTSATFMFFETYSVSSLAPRESMAWRAQLEAYYRFRSFKISRAAFAPDPPVSPAPGCVPEPHKYRFWIGVRYRAQSNSGRMVKN